MNTACYSCRVEYSVVLDFWFKEVARAQWFKKDAAFDDLVRSRFESVYMQAQNGDLSHWRSTPEGRVAEIIVLDQFPRNMFRGTPRAFATDELALTCAQEAVSVGDDMKLDPTMRQFLYMPYMHSESADVHAIALDLFTQLGNDENLQYEIEHKKIIDRFGRYPSRNEILGRTSTQAEIEFLQTHKGF
jgi:uncharacterized protein (DUF924 family)